MEELEQAQKLMKYQNKRGGLVLLNDIKKPEMDDWGIALNAIMEAQGMERYLNQEFLGLREDSESHQDYQVGIHKRVILENYYTRPGLQQQQKFNGLLLLQANHYYKGLWIPALLQVFCS